MIRWRAAAVMGALLLAAGAVAGCGAATAGSAIVNPSAAIPSPVPAVTTAPSGPGPDPAESSATGPPAVVTTTVTAVTTMTTAAPPAATTPPPPATTPPAAPPTDLAGEVYGFITAVDVAGATLTVDKIDWFTGAAAQQACAEDGVTDTANNRCTGSYFRNRNTALRQVPVAPTAPITVLAGGVHGMPGDLAAVAAEVAGHPPWRMIVTDGRVTDLKEVYLP